MNEPDSTAVAGLAASVGLGAVRELAPLGGGANNRVFRLDAENGGAVLKAYFRHPDDPRDRLGAEWAFARFARAAGLPCVPEPVACDPAAGLTLFEMVAGRLPSRGDVTAAAVGQAIAFVRGLSTARWRPLAARLPAASEACFSIAEHLGTVGRRVDRLATAGGGAAEFVSSELAQAWRRVVGETSDAAASLDRRLDLTDRCVSPSDFGFHNALLEPGGRVRFLDFEYAGWDDPAKLICDFFCQPAVPVPPQYFEAFAHAVAADFPEPDEVVARARLLLPVYRVKWVCIRLNEFLPAGRRRRAFALSEEELAARRTRQLEAARAALHDLQEVA